MINTTAAFSLLPFMSTNRHHQTFMLNYAIELLQKACMSPDIAALMPEMLFDLYKNILATPMTLRQGLRVKFYLDDKNPNKLVVSLFLLDSVSNSIQQLTNHQPLTYGNMPYHDRVFFIGSVEQLLGSAGSSYEGRIITGFNPAAATAPAKRATRGRKQKV